MKSWSLLLALAGLVSAAIQGLHFKSLKLGTLLVDYYWAAFYTSNFADGFRRRALMGSLMRLVSPAGANAVAINLFALLVLFVILAILIRAFVRLAEPLSAWSYMLAFAFFASSYLSIYFEVLGDLIQISLALFLIVALFAARRIQHGTARTLLLLLIMVVAFLFHEASIFLLAPCLPFVANPSPTRRDFALAAFALFALLTLSAAWSNVRAHSSYPIIFYPHGTAPETIEVEEPSFSGLLHSEYLADFGSARSTATFLSVVFRTVLLWFTGIIVFANLLPKPTFYRFFRVYLTLLLCSFPLWIIAHDWGRFMTYTLSLALVLAFLYPAAGRPGTAAPDWVSSSADLLLRLSRFVLVRLAAVVVLLLSPNENSRFKIMSPACLLISLPLIALAAAQVKGWIVLPAQPQDHISEAATR